MRNNLGLNSAVLGASCAFLMNTPFIAEADPPCEPQWSHVGSPGGLWRVNDLELWDPDGDGPEGPRIIAAGDFSQTPQSRQLNGVAAWNGRIWEPIGYDGNRILDGVSQWDHDSDSHTPALLIGAGRFADNWSLGVRRVKAWDGSNWTTLGDASGGGVRPMVQWDMDEDGPAPPRLVIAGTFTSINGIEANHLAMWDGVNWTPIPNASSSVNALATWDPDGPGPLPPLLVVGGYFPASGETPANGIAAWDGSQWAPIGTGLDGSVDSVKVLDIDGPGPLEAALIAGGSFTTSGGVPCLHIARWTGTEWSQIGNGVTTSLISSMCVVDPDGPGPAGHGLFLASGDKAYGWNGGDWFALDAGLRGGIADLVAADPDGDGPESVQLIAGGWVYHVGSDDSFPLSGMARWDGARWGYLGGGIHADVFSSLRIDALAVWDPDGNGALEPRVIAGGAFDTAGMFHTRGLAQWTGHQWEPVADPGLGGSNPRVTALLPWPVHPAPGDPQRLVIGGSFTQAGGAPANRIAVWDGETFQALAEGLTNAPTELAGWDPDGPGPLPEYLVANFNTTIKVWNGAVWTTFPKPTSSGSGYDLAVFDLDGPGPEPDALLVSGVNLGVGRRWNWETAAWDPLPSPGPGYPTFDSSKLFVADPDREGPLPARLFAIALYNKQSMPWGRAMAVLEWVDGAWNVIAQDENMSAGIAALGFWDPDGDGPASHRLVGVGEFIDLAQDIHGTVIELDGNHWRIVLEIPDPIAGEQLLCVAPLNAGAVGFPAGSIVAGGYTFPLPTVDGTCVVARIPCAQAPPVCPGDITGDLRTNAADFTVLASNFGASVEPLNDGDLNGDGLVNAADFTILAGNFGCDQN